jgi:hypothetical protein
VEPGLDDLLSDPIVDLLMRRDQIARSDVLDAVRTARRRLGLAAARPADVLAS